MANFWTALRVLQYGTHFAVQFCSVFANGVQWTLTDLFKCFWISHDGQIILHSSQMPHVYKTPVYLIIKFLIFLVLVFPNFISKFRFPWRSFWKEKYYSCLNIRPHRQYFMIAWGRIKSVWIWVQFYYYCPLFTYLKIILLFLTLPLSFMNYSVFTFPTDIFTVSSLGSPCSVYVFSQKFPYHCLISDTWSRPNSTSDLSKQGPFSLLNKSRQKICLYASLQNPAVSLAPTTQSFIAIPAVCHQTLDFLPAFHKTKSVRNLLIVLLGHIYKYKQDAIRWRPSIQSSAYQHTKRLPHFQEIRSKRAPCNVVKQLWFSWKSAKRRPCSSYGRKVSYI